MPFRQELHLLTALTLLLRHASVGSSTVIHVIQMIVGSGNSMLSYDVMAPAYDVALKNMARQYPVAFANLKVTRHFVAGEGLSCARSAGIVMEGLSTLLPDKNVSNQRQELRIVLTPGCLFEVMALGDFGRESDVTVLSSAVSQLLPTERFPTVLALSAMPFTVITQTVLHLVKRFAWKRFNLLCDRNRDPDQIQALEVMCNMIRTVTEEKLHELHAVVNYFDSCRPETYGTVIEESRKYSTVNVLVALTAAQTSFLSVASKYGMHTGEYVFIVLPLSPYGQLQDEIEKISLPISHDLVPLLRIIPYVFQVDLEDIRWNKLAEETSEMDKISQTTYNWTVIPERQHNALRLAAYESVLLLGSVVNEYYAQLPTMSAKTLASKFANRTFHISTRNVKTSSTGSRSANLSVKQYHTSTQSFQTVFLFNTAQQKLHSLDRLSSGEIEWPNCVQFPPDYRPLCSPWSQERCSKDTSSYDPATPPSITFCLLVLATLVIYVIARRVRHQDTILHTMWWRLMENFLVAGRPYNRERFRHFKRVSVSHFGLGFHRTGYLRSE